MNVVSTKIYNTVKRLAIQEGLSPDILPTHESNLSASLNKQFLPLDLLFQIYELADTHLEDGFAVRVGQKMSPDDYGILGMSWKTAWRARDIFERVERYIILITNKGDFETKDVGSNTFFLMKRPVNRVGQKLSNEATFSMCASILRQVTATDVSPISVSFQHEAPNDTLPYLEHFKCDVKFNEKQNAICYSFNDLNIQTIKADRSIHNFLLERMEEEKKGVEKNSNHLARDVEAIIRDSLPSGIPSIVMVGNLLGMSNRTLTRRLSESQISFRDLLKKTQESISKDLLQNSDLNIGEIAFHTGFSEQSAFNRAFKRWTGISPIEFRKM